jgi:hypothetical protein
MSVVRGVFAGIVASLALAPATQAAVVFDGSPGNGAAPATLGGWALVASPQDDRANFELVDNAPATVDTSFTFDSFVSLRTIGAGWISAPWAGGAYRGRVYYSNGDSSVTFHLPSAQGAVAFYAAPDGFGTFSMEAVAQDGTSSGPVTVVNPFPGPNRVGGHFFGFYGTGGDKVESVTVTYVDGLALGDFFLGDTRGAVPPHTPDAPASDQSRNADGHHTISWPVVTDDDGDSIDHYVVQHRDADDDGWSDLAIVAGTSYAFGAGENPAEGEGTWRYRVRAVDSTSTSGLFSAASDPVKVDRTRPHAPTLALHDPPAYGDWYADSALVDVTDNGDPLLQDNSAGTGVAPSSFDASFTVTETGTVTRSVQDNVGNASASSSLGVKVDRHDPEVAFSDCPAAPLAIGRAHTVHWAATDSESGIAGEASGSVALDTSSPGTRSVAAPQVSDHVGHRSADPGATCRYSVGYDFDGFYGKRIDNDGFNRLNAGSAIALKFSLDGPRTPGRPHGFGLGVLASDQPQATKVVCPKHGSMGQPRTVDGAVRSKLSWDRFMDQYRFTWKADRKQFPSGTCWALTLTFDDGTKSPPLRFAVK